ncbi:ORF5 [Chimpanzee stool associated circular ssDNA virus]|nr:ORF5 [Chimpanzee stool associated circular ssDNA virus]
MSIRIKIPQVLIKGCPRRPLEYAFVYGCGISGHNDNNAKNAYQRRTNPLVQNLPRSRYPQMGHRARRRQRRIRALAGQMQCPGRSGQRLDSIPKSGIWMARTNLNLDRGMFRQIHLRDQGRQILGIMGYDGSKTTAVR